LTVSRRSLIALAAAAALLSGCASLRAPVEPCSDAWIDARVSPAVADFAGKARDELAVLRRVVERARDGKDMRSFLGAIDMMQLARSMTTLTTAYQDTLGPVMNQASTQCSSPERVQRLAAAALRRSGAPEQILTWVDGLDGMLKDLEQMRRTVEEQSKGQRRT
jgi:hypothetical protein